MTSFHIRCLRWAFAGTLSLALGVAAGGLFACGEARAAGWGAALFMLARFVDHADGELARLTGRTSRIGYCYDYVAGALSTVTRPADWVAKAQTCASPRPLPMPTGFVV